MTVPTAKRFSVVRVAVALAISVPLLMLAIPWDFSRGIPVGPPYPADQQTMKRLVSAVQEGQESGKPLPSSTGYRFFIALFIGDGTGGRYQLAPGEEPYLNADYAAMLIAQTDENALDSEELRRLILQARETGRGVNDLGDEITTRWCSWAGPTDPTTAFGDAADQSRYVIASGMRNGRPFHDEGYIVASTIATRFIEYPADRAGDPTVPYGNPPLEFIAPYPNDTDHGTQRSAATPTNTESSE